MYFKILFLALISGSINFINCTEFKVYTANELTEALLSVSPGDAILLSRTGSSPVEIIGNFEITVSGTESAPITLRGHPEITLSSSIESSPVLKITANHWRLTDLQISGGDHGIKLFGANYNQIQHTHVRGGLRTIDLEDSNFNNLHSVIIESTEAGIGLEMITSSGNIIQNCKINGGSIGMNIIGNGGNNTIIGNHFKTTSEEYSSKYLLTMNTVVGANLITSNVFTYSRPTPTNDLIQLYNPKGVFENNTFYHEGGVYTGWAFIYIESSDYTVRGNRFFTSGISCFYISTHARRTVFEGNWMSYPKGDSNGPICIQGDPGVHSDNTIITDDNICINGRLTNIF